MKTSNMTVADDLPQHDCPLFDKLKRTNNNKKKKKNRHHNNKTINRWVHTPLALWHTNVVQFRERGWVDYNNTKKSLNKSTCTNVKNMLQNLKARPQQDDVYHCGESTTTWKYLKLC